MEVPSYQQVHNNSQSKRFLMTIGQIIHKGVSAGTVNCLDLDKRTILHSLFLLNSIVIATFGLFLELEWKKQTLFFDDICTWNIDVLELLIYGVSFYFFLLTIISACSAILCLGRINVFYNYAFELLIFYCLVTSLVSLVSLATYMLTSRLIDQSCETNLRYFEKRFAMVKQFEFRMVIITVFGLMTSVIYGLSSLSQRRKELNKARQLMVHERNRNIFHVNCNLPVIPPPLYSQAVSTGSRHYGPLYSDALMETESRA